MNPISSKVIRKFHLYKDETVTKLALQNGINSVPHLLVDFLCYAGLFRKPPPPSHEDFPNHHVWNSIDINVSDQVQKYFLIFPLGW